MNMLSQNQIYLHGDLAARASLLYARLEKKEYRPETILTMDQAGWPGDWEGRTILALVRLAEATGKEPAWLDEIVDIVLANRNERGYIGHILPDGEADEQQLSGHSWLLRGLIAYYRYTGDKRVYDAIQSIGQNLFLPVKDLYPCYPIRPEERVYAGEAAGNVAGVVGKWHISTDTGCAYIPLDGVSDLYLLTGDEKIGELLDVMIENYLKIDFLGICVQTHATLTAVRGILRTYRKRRNPAYLDAAKRIFAMYTEHGMTANYANYNWFRRPSWTEPCAIIDSFLVAVQLYTFTEERSYLTLAQRIYYNGMGFGQRENGGFGCDSCLGAVEDTENADTDTLFVKIPEAYWCCSMRGGEGLASVAKYAYFTKEEEKTVILPYFTSTEARIPFGCDGEELHLRQRTDYPYTGKAVFDILDNTVRGNVTLCAYLPDGYRELCVSGAVYEEKDGMLFMEIADITTHIEISFRLPLHTETPAGQHSDKRYKAVFEGNKMLSYVLPEDKVRAVLTEEMLEAAKADGKGGYTLGETALHPLFDAYENGHDARQVLFLM